MGKRKSTKDYAIRLIHPDIGEYYFNYCDNSNNFVFTQTLSRVQTWKTNETLNWQIENIESKLKSQSSRIILSLGKDVSDIKEEIKTKLICSMKRYYYPISCIKSKQLIENAKNNIIRLDKSLLPDSELITDMIKHSRQTDKNFISILKTLESDVNLYRKEYAYLQKNKNAEEIFLDIVDASYNFRLLKLKTLKNIQVVELENQDLLEKIK